MRSEEDEEDQLTPTKTRRTCYRGTVPRRAPPPAHSLSMEEEPDVSVWRVGEDEEQNPAAIEKLAVSLSMFLPYVKSNYMADQLLRI